MKLDDLVPDPEIRNWVGPFQDKGVYLESGRFEAERFVALAGIGESDVVLDLGCGCGRMSIHLAEYLKEGKYVGVDSSPPLLNWCKEKIATAFGNTSFVFIDVYNGSYNPEVPEEGLAHDETEIEKLYRRTGFTDAAIHHGSWIGREVDPSGSYQDLIVARKPR